MSDTEHQQTDVAVDSTVGLNVADAESGAEDAEVHSPVRDTEASDDNGETTAPTEDPVEPESGTPATAVESGSGQATLEDADVQAEVAVPAQNEPEAAANEDEPGAHERAAADGADAGELEPDKDSGFVSEPDQTSSFVEVDLESGSDGGPPETPDDAAQSGQEHGAVVKGAAGEPEADAAEEPEADVEAESTSKPVEHDDGGADDAEIANVEVSEVEWDAAEVERAKAEMKRARDQQVTDDGSADAAVLSAAADQTAVQDNGNGVPVVEASVGLADANPSVAGDGPKRKEEEHNTAAGQPLGGNYFSLYEKLLKCVNDFSKDDEELKDNWLQLIDAVEEVGRGMLGMEEKDRRKARDAMCEGVKQLNMRVQHRRCVMMLEELSREGMSLTPLQKMLLHDLHYGRAANKRDVTEEDVLRRIACDRPSMVYTDSEMEQMRATCTRWWMAKFLQMETERELSDVGAHMLLPYAGGSLNLMRQRVTFCRVEGEVGLCLPGNVHLASSREELHLYPWQSERSKAPRRETEEMTVRGDSERKRQLSRALRLNWCWNTRQVKMPTCELNPVLMRALSEIFTPWRHVGKGEAEKLVLQQQSGQFYLERDTKKPEKIIKKCLNAVQEVEQQLFGKHQKSRKLRNREKCQVAIEKFLPLLVVKHIVQDRAQSDYWSTCLTLHKVFAHGCVANVKADLREAADMVSRCSGAPGAKVLDPNSKEFYCGMAHYEANAKPGGDAEQAEAEDTERLNLVLMHVWITLQQTLSQLSVKNNAEFAAQCLEGCLVDFVAAPDEHEKACILFTEALGMCKDGAEAGCVSRLEQMQRDFSKTETTQDQLLNALNDWKKMNFFATYVPIFPSDLLPTATHALSQTEAHMPVYMLNVAKNLFVDCCLQRRWSYLRVTSGCLGCACPCRVCCPVRCYEHSEGLRKEQELSKKILVDEKGKRQVIDPLELASEVVNGTQHGVEWFSSEQGEDVLFVEAEEKEKLMHQKECQRGLLVRDAEALQQLHASFCSSSDQ